ncbi:hypothetical protein VNO78_15892 [Psophocarpus tetragonolobus]|uniref:Uncharacterized protein n=1 Tax=Psophocarpus tetragonolobus TaxID=3891 RepID=A0AAN9XK04_PSOTE
MVDSPVKTIFSIVLFLVLISQDSTIKILNAITFLVLISQGYSQCYLRDIVVSQIQTGVKVKGKPEWSVTVTNKCPCVHKNVILSCTGFQSTEPINPLVLKVSPRGCLLNAGQPLYRDDIKFKYAWDQQFPFKPLSSQISCS